MLEHFLNGENVNIIVAFVAGFITFFASCLIPLVPTYLALLTGNHHLEDKKQRPELLWVASWFVLGFTSSFVTLSFGLQHLARTLGPWRVYMQQASGGVFILAGLLMLGLSLIPFLNKEWRLNSWQEWLSARGISVQKSKVLLSFIFGVFFGFGWTPCIGPVLAVILFWSAQQASVWQGLFLLISFGIGLGTPFLLVAAAYERLYPLFMRWQRGMHLLQLVAAVVIILTGIMLLTGGFSVWHGILGTFRFTF